MKNMILFLIRYKKFVFLFYFFSTAPLYSQELPPIQSFSTTDYKGGNQNWAITQTQSRWIYVANNKGLLEYNGANWTLYPTPNESIMRSAYAVNDTIYTGCYMDFGFWKKNTKGELIYTSLVHKYKIPIEEDEQFWKIIHYENHVLFQSLNRIHILDTKENTFNIINSKKGIAKMFLLNNQIYFQAIDEGLFKIQNGSSKLVSNDKILINNQIVAVFKNEENLLIQTQLNGFYNLKNNILQKTQQSSNAFFKNKVIYNSIQSTDGHILSGTISNGLTILNEKGDLQFNLTQSTGLSNNTVLCIFEDSEKNIWLGLDDGINLIEFNSPIKVYNDYKGDIGTVYTSEIYEGKLYLGTNQGLFYKQIDSNTNFKLVPNSLGQVWFLKDINGQLFYGHNNGTFIVTNNSVQKISNIAGTWMIQEIPNQPNILIQGNFDGLHILEKQNNSWKWKNKLEGFDISSRNFEMIDKQIFVNHEYKGVYQLKYNTDFTKITSIKLLTELDKNTHSHIFKYKKELYYSNKKGVFRYTNNTFKRDSILSTTYTSQTYTTGKFIGFKDSELLFGFSQNNLSLFEPAKLSNKLDKTIYSLPLTYRKTNTGFENITILKKNKFLIGTSRGYIILDKEKLVPANFNLTINSITVKNRTNQTKKIDLNEQSKFAPKNNNIQFKYSVTNYNPYLTTSYSYRLKGLYENWSDWQEKTEIEFNNLPFGNYTFEVKAKTGTSNLDQIATYSFEIKRPFLNSYLAYFIYIILLVAIYYFIHRAYKRYYKKQRKDLIERKLTEIKRNEMANQQMVMKIKNEQLQQDIEHKSRELAISTMSMIKKNEFLHTIKTKLASVENDPKVKSVISIINKNLNSTDDWDFFEKAFNNADKDFLKTIQEKHPNLTPNDLKLCAYLRLNLSSKEIAPLLNISIRSVEVKRYRLRKRMELEHETSLTSYILEL